MKQEAVFQQVKDTLVELFELNPADIKPETTLYQELDLDSIDAVDLVVHLQNLTGKKIKPDDFKSVRTVQDIVDAIEKLQLNA